jgi:Ca-activated chloride channel family protein
MPHILRWLLILVLIAPALTACGGNGIGIAPGGNTVEISIAYGSEKRAWLEEAVGQFNAAGQKTARAVQPFELWRRQWVRPTR